MSAARWRSLIGTVVRDVWPQLADGAAWIEAQVHVESRGNPAARSPVGALGLLQLMPATADEVAVVDPLDPEQNLRGGVRYLRGQYERLGEVPDPTERLLWSFASYNCGRGYIDFNGGAVDTALELAKQRGDAEGMRQWWRWDYGKADLPRVTFHGHRPDFHQVWDYVFRIRQAKAHPQELET
jgi:soluble lytic murein transglycosylase-like protein